MLSSLFLQKRRVFAYRKRCLCIGLNLARSFTLLWPFLWSVHTLKEPCMSSFPRSLRSPCEKRTHIQLNFMTFKCSFPVLPGLRWYDWLQCCHLPQWERLCLCFPYLQWKIKIKWNSQIIWLSSCWSCCQRRLYNAPPPPPPCVNNALTVAEHRSTSANDTRKLRYYYYTL